MSRFDSEPKPRVQIREGTFQDASDFSDRLKSKKQEHAVPPVMWGRQRTPKITVLAIDSASGQVIGVMVGTMLEDRVISGDWLASDNDFAELQPGAVLIRHAQNVCDEITLNAFPYYFDRDASYGKLRQAVERMKQYYLNLDFKLVDPEDSNSTAMIWKRLDTREG